MTHITEIDRRSDEFHDLVKAIADASEKIFIRSGCPIPPWFEDTNRSVATAFVEEIIDRGLEIENRNQ